jgi:hypothetical protein
VINALAQLGLGGKEVIIGETLPADQYYGAEALNYPRIEEKKSVFKSLSKTSPANSKPRKFLV